MYIESHEIKTKKERKFMENVKKFLEFFDGYFFKPLMFELKAAPDAHQRKKILYKSLNIVACNYCHNCQVSDTAKEKGKEVIYYLSSNTTDININDHMDRLIECMIKMVVSFDESREALLRPVLFKLLCLTIALNVSDNGANMLFRELCKELDEKFYSSFPNQVAVRCLKKVENGYISELELLEKYSFWIKKGIVLFAWSHFF